MRGVDRPLSLKTQSINRLIVQRQAESIGGLVWLLYFRSISIQRPFHRSSIPTTQPGRKRQRTARLNGVGDRQPGDDEMDSMEEARRKRAAALEEKRKRLEELRRKRAEREEAAAAMVVAVDGAASAGAGGEKFSAASGGGIVKPPPPRKGAPPPVEDKAQLDELINSLLSTPGPPTVRGAGDVGQQSPPTPHVEKQQQEQPGGGEAAVTTGAAAVAIVTGLGTYVCGGRLKWIGKNDYSVAQLSSHPNSPLCFHLIRQGEHPAGRG